MNKASILNVYGGVDVVSPEGQVTKGCARVVENVVLRDDGSFELRPGTALAVAASRPHSLWSTRDQSRAFVVAGDTLYAVHGGGATRSLESIATGLWSAPVRFTEHGDGNIYVSGGTILRIDQHDAVSVPGLVALDGVAPTLSTATGGLTAGRYGVAFCGVSSSGEESPPSDVSWIDLASASGISVSLPTRPTGVATWRVFRTPQNGDELYLADETASTSITLAGGGTGRAMGPWPLTLAPAGSEIASYRGYLLTALGNLVIVCEPMRPGVFNPRHGFYTFDREVTILQPVETGVFVGTDNAVYFLAGDKPSAWNLSRKAHNGAFKHSSLLVDPNMLDGKAIDTTTECAVWLSPVGYQIGLPGGGVLSPQSDKILLSDVPRAPTAAFIRDGVKQMVSATEAMTLGSGGATDTPPNT